MKLSGKCNLVYPPYPYPEVVTWNHAPMAPEFFSGVVFRAGSVNHHGYICSYEDIMRQLTNTV